MTEGIFADNEKYQSLVKIVREMNLKKIWMNLLLNRSKHQKYFWDPGLADVEK